MRETTSQALDISKPIPPITKLSIVHDGEDYHVIEPTTGTKLTSSCLREFCESYRDGFLSCILAYHLSVTTKYMGDTEKSEENGFAYLLGVEAANKLCEAHIRKGGTFLSLFQDTQGVGDEHS